MPHPCITPERSLFLLPLPVVCLASSMAGMLVVQHQAWGQEAYGASRVQGQEAGRRRAGGLSPKARVLSQGVEYRVTRGKVRQGVARAPRNISLQEGGASKAGPQKGGTCRQAVVAGGQGGSKSCGPAGSVRRPSPVHSKKAAAAPQLGRVGRARAGWGSPGRASVEEELRHNLALRARLLARLQQQARVVEGKADDLRVGGRAGAV